MPDHHEILNFLLLLALIVAAAKGAGWLSLRLGQPAVLGELVAGVVRGPSLLDLLRLRPFAGEGMAAGVFLLANVGVVLLMFIAGLETDLEQMRKVGRGRAVVDDVIALVVLAVFVAVSLSGGGGLAGVGVVLLRMAAFFVVAILLGRFLRPALGRAERAPVSEGLLAVTLVAVLDS